jgi:putative lumazine-binding protein
MRLALLALLTLAVPLHAQTAADSSAIRSTALDYVEGWYEGNPARMDRALHPELVKRIVVSDTATKHSVLETMGASALVNGTRHGWGKQTPKDRQQKDVIILDIFGNAASVKAIMADWIDYLQIAKVDGRWVLVNMLWEQKPGAKGFHALLAIVPPAYSPSLIRSIRRFFAWVL